MNNKLSGFLKMKKALLSEDTLLHNFVISLNREKRDVEEM